MNNNPIKPFLFVAVISLIIGALIGYMLFPSETITADLKTTINEKEKANSELQIKFNNLLIENLKLKQNTKGKIKITETPDGTKQTEIDFEQNTESEKQSEQITSNNTDQKTTSDKTTNSVIDEHTKTERNVSKYMLGITGSFKQDYGVIFIAPLFWRFNVGINPTFNIIHQSPNLNASLLITF
jgi:hypothetical protein